MVVIDFQVPLMAFVETRGWPYHRKRVGVAHVENRLAEIGAAGHRSEVDAELLDDVTLHFRDRHLEHDLVAAVNVDPIDDLLAVVDEARGDIEGLLCLDRGRDIAGQHEAVAEPLDTDVQAGQRLLEGRAQSVEIARHRDVEPGDLAPFGIEEVDAGLAPLDADDVGTAGRADHRIGDLRVGDQHVLDVARHVDHHRLADPERNELGIGLAGGDLDHRRRTADHARIGGRRAAGGRQPEGGDQSGEQCGVDQRRVPHLGPLIVNVHFGVVIVVTP